MDNSSFIGIDYWLANKRTMKRRIDQPDMVIKLLTSSSISKIGMPSWPLFSSHDLVHILLFRFLLFFFSALKTTIAKVRFILLYFTTILHFIPTCVVAYDSIGVKSTVYLYVVSKFMSSSVTGVSHFGPQDPLSCRAYQNHINKLIKDFRIT